MIQSNLVTQDHFGYLKYQSLIKCLYFDVQNILNTNHLLEPYNRLVASPEAPAPL